MDQDHDALAGVTFLDSTILGTLVNGLHNAGEFGVSFTVTNPGRMTLRLLTMTGLLEVLADTPDAGARLEDLPG
ncbi:STAS domain-containing protein [Paractinoplanes hotanensis]|uniref:STAS domain-containing protein n=1 Tax=Paractinoplanes hotanensis TaxID=2906497 RepID=UPI0034DB1EE2